MTAPYDVFIRQGETDALSITWSSGDDPIDLTGYTARFSVRVNFQSSTTVLDLKSSTGDILLTAEGGITVKFNPEVTSLIPLDVNATVKKKAGLPYLLLGRYNMEMTKTSTGVITRLIEGDFYMDAEIVR